MSVNINFSVYDPSLCAGVLYETTPKGGDDSARARARRAGDPLPRQRVLAFHQRELGRVSRRGGGHFLPCVRHGGERERSLLVKTLELCKCFDWFDVLSKNRIKGKGKHMKAMEGSFLGPRS